jgi:universal stress protein E
MQRFKNILYVADASAPHPPCIARALSLAESNQASLTVIDVIPPIPQSLGLLPRGLISGDLEHTVLAEHHKLLLSIFEPHQKSQAIQLEVRAGIQFLEVIRMVLQNNHDLVIKAAENPHWIERLFGSNDMHLLRKCPCPVWLMRPDEKPDYDCIVSALDYDPLYPETVEQGLNQQILEISVSLALSDLASLHIVHAWDAAEAEFVRIWTENPDAAAASLLEGERRRQQEGLDRLRKQLEAKLGSESYRHLAPHFHLPQGEANKVIPELVTKLQADLLVMGTVTRTGVQGLIMGNAAESILDQTKCSVLAVKPPGFVSPVKI